MSNKPYESTALVPEVNDNEPHFFYIMSVHCAERSFGYAIVEMTDDDIFNEFYNVWVLNVSITLERLFKNDRINKLIGSLEDLSIRDGLTGMLNRRGFEENSQRSLQELNGTHTVCTMVIDMDGLKRINDQHGHFEGDNAIKALADMIIECCVNGEIAGRAGGDEFYIYAADYSEEKLTHFITDLTELTSTYNDTFGKPYKIEISWGAYLTEADNTANLDELIKVSDKRMYEQKMSKPNKRH
jgi:diguanylate cyclase (GGDEF)-like protein